MERKMLLLDGYKNSTGMIRSMPHAREEPGIGIREHTTIPAPSLLKQKLHPTSSGSASIGHTLPSLIAQSTRIPETEVQAMENLMERSMDILIGMMSQ